MNTSTNIVIINQSTGSLMIDIVNAYHRVYPNVTLITGKISKGERELSNVKIDKTIKYDKRNKYKRIYTWVISTLQIFIKLLFKYRNSYVIYVTNPPSSYFCSLLLSNRFSIIVYDIYPDALKNIGINERNIIYRTWGRINRIIFKKAEYIYTLSNGMRSLLSKYTATENIRVVPNWSTSTFNKINRKENPFIAKHDLQDKFIVMYSGNIGYTHNVETIVDLAIQFKDDDKIKFVIIGEGGKKETLIKMADENNLSNCLFLGYQPVDDLIYSLSAADISVITLTKDTEFVSVPSKTYNLLAVGSPLLCIASRESELGVLVKENECGECFEQHEIPEMVSYINKVKDNPEYKLHLANKSLTASESYTYRNADKYVI